MNKNVSQMTKKELLEIKNFITKKEIFSIVIVPTDEEHDSGFMCMKYILLGSMNEIVGAVGGGSDVLHINGICGFGPHLKLFTDDRKVPAHDWKIDCLQNGLIRLFCGKELEINGCCSDFEIYVKEDIK